MSVFIGFSLGYLYATHRTEIWRRVDKAWQRISQYFGPRPW